jgi:cytochrome c-type biogenesis protein CcmH
MMWLLFSALTALVFGAVIRAAFGAGSSTEPEAYEVDVYKAQLTEFNREEDRGMIEKTDAQSARTEMTRRLLKANRQARKGADAGKTAGWFAPVAAAIAIGAFGVYVLAGSPSLADQAPDKKMSTPSEEQALKIETETLESRVRENSGDVGAWARLGPAYFKAGELEKAAGAFRKVIELKAETEETLLGLAETLIFGNNGDVSLAAKEALNAAILKNPKSGRGRLWLAMAAEQAGKKDDAQKTYREMLNDDLTGPLRRMVTERLAGLSATPAQLGAPHGSSSENAPKGHEGGIPGMVDKLAERLKTSGGSLENWVMLIRSYYVLKEEAKAQEAVTLAKQKFASDPEALAAIEAAVSAATAPEAKEPEQAAPSSPDEKAEQFLASAPPGGHGSMVQGMVSRLAERLKDNKGNLEDWLQLIRSYSVLKDEIKAQEAVQTARGQFASDAKALERIDALVGEVKLTPTEAKPGAPKS